MIDPLNIPTKLSSPQLVSNTKVANVIPHDDILSTVPYRIAIVGEAPRESDELYRQPFMGAHGKLLDSFLYSNGINRAAVFLGHVLQTRVPGDDMKNIDVADVNVLDGRAQLFRDLETFRPNIVLCMGDLAFWALRGHPYGIVKGYSADDFRGTLFTTDSIGGLPGLKCCVTNTLQSVLVSYGTWPLVSHDIKRACSEATFPTLELPKRHFDLDLTANEICSKLDTWPSGHPMALDIEGGLEGWTCISIAESPTRAFIINFSSYNEADQGRIYTALSRVCYRADIPKILQNALYDSFVLYYGFNIIIRNIAEDTMLKSAVIYPELPKGLATAASLWTREPQWKQLIAYTKEEQRRRAKAGVSQDIERRNKLKACCIDSCVTYEISNEQEKVLLEDPKEHTFYRRKVALLPAFLYMEKRGFAYDVEAAKQKHSETVAALEACAQRLNAAAGKDLRGAKGSLSAAKVKNFLYTQKGYPPQYKGRGPSKTLSSDVLSLLKLMKQRRDDPVLHDLLLFSHLEGLRKSLAIEADPDGRVRCAYNLVGTETMRISCYTSPTGSGMNLQTVTKELRNHYRADPGMHLFQCDLAGADGWTVAARCKSFGDPTMWDDYMFGLKPAKIVALMKDHGIKINALSREELKEMSKSVNSDDWLYFGCKRCQHATNYGTTAITGAEQILKDSYKISGKPFYMLPKEFETLQRLYLIRYPGLYQWHNWVKKQVYEGANLTSASGHTRKFFGRRRSWNHRIKQYEADQDTFREFLADEPQENTTEATNRALERLWNDPENRRPDGSLIIEPLHTVHDALIGQFPQEMTEWAVPKIRSYFYNPLTIAGMEVVIPFEGAYGPSWGELGPKYGGGDI